MKPFNLDGQTVDVLDLKTLLITRGIVPLFSIWLPHHRPVRGSTTPPALDYYRRARRGFADLFARYKLEPPGASGLNVCMCRDLSLQRQSAASPAACER